MHLEAKLTENKHGISTVCYICYVQLHLPA